MLDHPMSSPKMTRMLGFPSALPPPPAAVLGGGSAGASAAGGAASRGVPALRAGWSRPDAASQPSRDPATSATPAHKVELRHITHLSGEERLLRWCVGLQPARFTYIQAPGARIISSTSGPCCPRVQGVPV